PFANATIKGTSINTTTNEKGEYILKIEPGVYKIEFSFIGYENVEVPVTVKDGAIVEVNISLGSGGYQLKDVVIQNVRRKNTESALVLEMKEAKQVISAISAEQMKKGTDNNAAEAMQRVPGVTIVNGRYVMIRGLSQRYNNVLINNALAPSTEVDLRTFSFDLIPTQALDKLVVYKTGSANIPGDFAGGIIEVTTSENTKEFTKAQIGFGFVNGTTFNDYLQSEGSNTDFLGFDNGFRQLPSSFPSTSVLQASGRSSQLRVDAAHSLQNNFDTENSTAFLDTRVSMGLGRNFNIGSVRVNSTNIFGQSTQYQYFQRSFNRYFTLNEGQDRPQDWLDYLDETHAKKSRITILSNWNFKFNDKNTIKFKNLFNQIGQNETIIRNGYNYQQGPDNIYKNYALSYNQRFIYTGQLEGIHKLDEKNKLDWVIGFNSVNDITPDLRRFRTFRDINSSNPNFTIIDPPSSNLFDNSRYFGESKEFNVGNGVNYTYTLERIKGDVEFAPIKLKAGYYVDYRSKEFNSRYFSYLVPGYVSTDRAIELKNLPLSDVFNNQNVNATDGWVIEEGTRPIDSFSGTNLYGAGYVMAELPLGKFDVTAGVRLEHNVQNLNAKDDFEDKSVEKATTFVLPSLNVAYALNEKNLLRFAYSRTLNRPEFREIAPFLFYDFIYDRGIEGRPLEVATIDNFDLRYEIYPRKGETMSFGLFYKSFKNPIELVAQITTEQPQFFYKNADKAQNAGVEIEFRKSFSELFSSPFLQRFSTNINAAYIISEVNLGNVTSQQADRALQGQSPYIINVALGYEDKDKGLSANLIYNRFGDRIDTVGDILFPTIYELSRDNIDFTISKDIKNITVKLGIQDLLNSPYRLFEDSNRDEKINSRDNVVSNFKRGTMFNLDLTYNF
ncbi:carboxypeptidase-like regulatory domain-containing protein, partial [Flavobacterium sp.]|uniref:TonB-dependent receptor n=1 Tax=Flavobacterium sp. TaxID=239 RepID=UPI003919E238